MTRFSEIAREIESEYEPNFDLDISKTAPPVRYIEYRLLELCEVLDARLTALEAAKPQMDGAASCDEMLDTLLLSNADKRAAIANLTTELADLTRQRDNAWGAIDEYVDQRNALAAQVDDLRNVNAGLRKSLDAAQADNKQLASERKTLSSVWHALKIDNERLAAEVDRLRNIESAAPNPPNHTDSEKLAFARNEIDWLRNTLDEAQARIRHLEATRR